MAERINHQRASLVTAGALAAFFAIAPFSDYLSGLAVAHAVNDATPAACTGVTADLELTIPPNYRVIEPLVFITDRGNPQIKIRIGHEHAIMTTLSIEMKDKDGNTLGTKCIDLSDPANDDGYGYLTTDLLVFNEIPDGSEVAYAEVIYLIKKQEAVGTSTEESRIQIPPFNHELNFPFVEQESISDITQ